MYKLLVFDRNTWDHVTVQIISIKNDYLKLESISDIAARNEIGKSISKPRQNESRFTSQE